MSNSAKYDFDYFVIGAGSGGVRSSRIAAGHGARVGIAEGRFFGGTCVNVGCVPKKLFSYAADFKGDFEDSAGYGWRLNGTPDFDWATLIAAKDKEIGRLNKIYEGLLTGAGVKVFNGYARFTGPHTVEVNGKTVSAANILIATGGRPRRPNFKGAEHVIVSDDAFSMTSLPKSIVIQGGGYIAVEFAHIFSGLGVDTTLVYRGDLFLRGFDRDIAKALADEMHKKGVKVLFNTDIAAVAKGTSGYDVTLSDGQIIKTGLVMSAIGRDAATDALNLAAAGVKTGKDGVIPVDRQYRTNIRHIRAVGDVIGKVALTPVALAEGHYIADTVFGGVKRQPPKYENIPSAVFSDPNIGTVGMTEDAALAKGHEIDVYKSGFTPLKHTLSGRNEKTLMKMIVDRKTDRVLGIHMIGRDVPEILQGFAAAVVAGAKKKDLDRTIGIHPTAAEELVTMRKPAYSRP